jgi:hypothetical protein
MSSQASIDRPVATVALLIARPDGLVPPLSCIAKQDFSEPWEVLVVNWGFGEQDELVRALWDKLRPDIPLRHVPLLPPLPIKNGKYGSWDMGTTYNTAWANALGEFTVFTEDFWVFKENWLSEHMKVVRTNHGFCMGVNLAEPAFDEKSERHYRVDAIIMHNFSHLTKIAWENTLGAPEWPTRHPEVNVKPFVFNDAEVVRVWNAYAWHLAHYPGGTFGRVMRKHPYTSGGQFLDAATGASFEGDFPYYDVEFIHNSAAYNHYQADDWEPYRRNIRVERERLGHWT